MLLPVGAQADDPMARLPPIEQETPHAKPYAGEMLVYCYDDNTPGTAIDC